MSHSDRLQALQALRREDPDDALLLYGLAMELRKLGRPAEALAAFEELTAKHPAYVPGLLQGGLLLQAEDRPDDARAWFERALAAAQNEGDTRAADEIQGFLEMLA